MNLCLPESLHIQVRELAERDKVSINQFVTLAVAEKVAALRTLAYFGIAVLRPGDALLRLGT